MNANDVSKLLDIISTMMNQFSSKEIVTLFEAFLNTTKYDTSPKNDISLSRNQIDAMADARRLDWLEDGVQREAYCFSSNPSKPVSKTCTVAFGAKQVSGPTLRDAIDSARKLQSNF